MLAVLALELALLLLGESAEWITRRGPRRVVIGHREGTADRQVCSDPREWFEHLTLGLIEPLGQGAHEDDEADTDRQAERSQCRAPAAAANLGQQVPDVEHARVPPQGQTTSRRVVASHPAAVTAAAYTASRTAPSAGASSVPGS